MDKFVEEAIDNLDACVFSGDPAHIDVDEMRGYLDRWSRALDAIELTKEGEES